MDLNIAAFRTRSCEQAPESRGMHDDKKSANTFTNKRNKRSFCGSPTVVVSILH